MAVFAFVLALVLSSALGAAAVLGVGSAGAVLDAGVADLAGFAFVAGSSTSMAVEGLVEPETLGNVTGAVVFLGLGVEAGALGAAGTGFGAEASLFGFSEACTVSTGAKAFFFVALDGFCASAPSESSDSDSSGLGRRARFFLLAFVGCEGVSDLASCFSEETGLFPFVLALEATDAEGLATGDEILEFGGGASALGGFLTTVSCGFQGEEEVQSSKVWEIREDMAIMSVLAAENRSQKEPAARGGSCGYTSLKRRCTAL